MAYVLVQGENKFTDKGSAISNKEVRKAFLGG